MYVFLRSLGLLLCCWPVLASSGECDDVEQGMIQVVQAQWCSGVERINRLCQQAVVAGSKYVKLNYKPLYLWTRISGDDAAINKLERCGKLPVYHKWYVIKYYGLDKEKARLIDEIPLCAGGKKEKGRCQSVTDVANKLRLEFQERGFFDWTTWSYKQRIYKGAWQVRVLYQDNTPVMCSGKPCVYKAKVTTP